MHNVLDGEYRPPASTEKSRKSTKQNSYTNAIGTQFEHGDIGEGGEVLHLWDAILDEEQLLELGQMSDVLDVFRFVVRNVQKTAKIRKKSD